MTPYVDGTLSMVERDVVDRHLAGCGPCRRAVDEAEGGRQVLRHAGDRLTALPPPPGLRTRCEAIARAHGRRRAPGWIARLAPAAAAALLILGTAVIVFAMATHRSNVLLAQQLTVDHAKCFRFLAPIGGHDAHTVEAMLADRYGWDVHVPPSSDAAGLSLVGARRCLYAAGTIPHLMYRLGGEDLSLFVLEGERRRPDDVSTLGHRSRIWSQEGRTYVLVSSQNAGRLDEAAEYIMQQEKRR